MGTWFCMAGDAAKLPSTTCIMTLFFSLILAFHFTIAVPERSFSTLTSTKDGANKSNTMVVVTASARDQESATQNPKTEDITPKQTHVPDLVQGGPNKGRRPSKAPLRWKNRIFNASEHEVPSGPNPISNSSVHIIVMKLNHTYQSFKHEDMCT
ncbi:hypothetical protein RJT34_14749 [Clitoria ternatea]|uniref:Uncharacterized protein n=1 Tax=Clitoria ternatea TaxID=43366 RepID=A0AAN9JTU6_CLITE